MQPLRDLTREVIMALSWRVLLLFVLALPGSSWARQAGDFEIQFGLLQARAQESNSAPRVVLRDNPLLPVLGVERRFKLDDVELRVPRLHTLALNLKYFVTDHWAVSFAGGYPRRAGIFSSGRVAPTGPLGETLNLDTGREAFNPAVSARQWTPILYLEYHFGRPRARLRPYVGVGATYTFFTGVELDKDLTAAANRRFGTPLATLAGRPGPTDIDISVDSVFAAAFSAGLGIAVSERWRLTASLAYLPLATTGTVRLKAADGTRLATADTRLRFDPVLARLVAGYRF